MARREGHAVMTPSAPVRKPARPRPAAAGLALAACVLLAAASGAWAIAIDSLAVVAPADPAAVPRYEKFELLVTLSGVTATSLYSPLPAQGGLDLRATFTPPAGDPVVAFGFYDGAAWRVRFAPGSVGRWSYSVVAQDSSGLSNAAAGEFTCVDSPHAGWAAISGNYLRLSNGKVLFAVGHNTGWQGDVEQPPLSEMAARGENLLSFWLAQPWAKPSDGAAAARRAPIENIDQGVGQYNQAACDYLDGVVARAEAAGVYLLPTLWSHGQLRVPGTPWPDGWWDKNPYKNLCSASDFYKTTSAGADTPQWQRQKNFYRYVIARWGHSRAIAGWVLLCEIDGTTGYVQNAADALGWCFAAQAHFAQLDPLRRNALGRYPIGVSKTDEGASPAWNAWMDLRLIDSYLKKSDNYGVASTIASETALMRSGGAPGLHSEFGGRVVSGGATQPTHLHNGIWAGAASGAAMTPLVWCDGGEYPMLTSAMQDHLQYLSQFMSAVDYLGAPDLAPAAPTPGVSGWLSWCMKTPDRAYGWLLNPSGNLTATSLTLAGFTPGDYRVEWFDVWSSGATPLRTDALTVPAGGALAASVPALARRDIAYRIRPQDPPPTTTTTSTTTTTTSTTTTTTTSTTTTTTLPALFYLNDSSAAEPGSVCTAPGDDANDGFSPAAPMRNLQTLLNRYPAIGVGRAVCLDPGTYPGNVVLSAAHKGLALRGAGPGRTILDGAQTGTCLVLDGMITGEVSGMTLRNGRAAGAGWPNAHGGALRCLNGTAVTLERLELRDNTASYGGALYSNNSAPLLRNCLIRANRTTTAQGVLLLTGTRNPTLLNCTIAHNLLNSGGVRSAAPCAPVIRNCILWGNGDELYACAATWSCIEDGDAGTGNIAAAPNFADPAAGDFHLTAGSPCIDAADAASAPATDMDGLPRRDDAVVLPNGSAYPDIGAYEYPQDTPADVIYVNDAAFDEPGSLCRVPGDDANHGFSPWLPMRTIQGVLAKYPALSAGKTVRIDPGLYPENITLGPGRSGLKLQGAGAGRTVIDGGQLGSCFVLNGFGGELSGMTLRNGRAAGAGWPNAHGGALRCLNGTTALLDALELTDNLAQYGGALYSNNSAPLLRNCLIRGNRTTTAQGVLLLTGNRNPTLLNCTIAHNLLNSGGVRSAAPCAPVIRNCILWANGDELNGCTATWSCIEDGDAGTGNIAANPLFLAPASGNFRLAPGSPCIDTGTPAGAPTSDLDGAPRDAAPDMGAYEYES
jgi:hypothetical protein